jgi:MYXO-CTERM domain-containing protein
MTRSTMRGLLHRAATTALLTLLPSVAWAQVSVGTPTGQTTGGAGTGGISPNLLVYRNKGSGNPETEVEHGTTVYASKQYDCQPGSLFKFTTTYSTPIPVVEAWLGVGSDVDCSVPANRMVSSVASELTKCMRLGSQPGATKFSLEVSGPRTFDSEQTESDPEFTCDSNVQGGVLYTVWILALPKPTTAVDAPPTIAGNTNAVLKASFTPYLVEPKPPVDVAPINAESRLGIEFDQAEDAKPLWQYKAWFDFGSGGAECGSGILDDPTSKPSTGLANIRGTKASSNKDAYVSVGDDVPFDSFVRAVAVAIDPAGNESLLSEGVCVKRVQTTSFLDACDIDPDCTGSLDSCSVSPGRTASGVFGLSLFVLALGALLQRRRSR